jgi:hypothetical protein
VLITGIDISFVVVGLAVVIFALRNRRAALRPAEGPPVTGAEVLLTTLGLIPAAVGPNILVVALTPGMPEMHLLSVRALIPSIVLLAGVWGLASYLRMWRLTNRIASGLWVGACSTAVLDVIRLTGFSFGWLPGNMPRMFGVLLLNRMALGPSPLSDVVGYVYHFWVGACFGLTYTLLIGHTRWWGPLIWGVLIEIGMMTTPPMVIAMDTGFFGLQYGKGYEILTVSGLAHIAYGLVLGFLVERYVVHRGIIYLEYFRKLRRFFREYPGFAKKISMRTRQGGVTG